MDPNHLPDAFKLRAATFIGDGYEDFLAGLNSIAPVSIRVNPRKRTDLFNECDKILWATDGYYLAERISFTLDPLFHAGCYYVQEASSMYLETAVKSTVTASGPLRVLDLCAAPGGKSTHLLSFLPSGSVLVSNEIIPARNKTLQQNMIKWGYPNVIVTQNEAADFERLPSFFDVMVVDAPCSGEGLFRKDPDAVNEWSEKNVMNCAVRQSAILDEVIPALKENGILIYSTCTYEPSENDEQIARLLASGEFECIDLPADGGIVKTKYGVQFYPHRVKGEGFYMAAIRKIAGAEAKYKREKSFYHEKYRSQLKSWLNSDDGFVPFEKDGELYAIPAEMEDVFPSVMKNLYVRSAGVHLGKLIRDELIPAHELALSTEHSMQIASVEVDADAAIRYLKCEAIEPGDVSVGWKIVRYRNFALGWIKVLKGRINNYFPTSQRILMKNKVKQSL